jgi:FkbM family methyltransferase
MSPRIISYAQNGEDVVLWRAFRDQPTGFYIDVGANHPVNDSVTKLFYDHGWHGINIEPQPHLHAALSAARPRDLNLNVGVSAQPGTLELHELVETDGLSTFSSEMIDRYRSEGRDIVTRQIPVTTLAQVYADHDVRDVDFLKIDVEGFEEQVLQGTSFATVRPRVLIVERTFPERWMSLVEAAGYTHVQYDGINDFFVRNEDVDQLGELVSQPATIALDGFDPYLYVQQLEIATANIHALQQEVAALRAIEQRGRVERLRDYARINGWRQTLRQIGERALAQAQLALARLRRQ